MQDILLTAVDLLKLEKVEFGGVRGRGLSQQVQCLHQEFLDTYKTLTEKPYDCLDLNNKVPRRLGYREEYKDTNPYCAFDYKNTLVLCSLHLFILDEVQSVRLV